ncbi:hypothetical protein [Streptomyces zagrosensis]|uniref:DUF2273 domain-containing protein n=1 Tax=Streptomyces zagrosensis TaxID=1042984 RepID=A0A7W9Q550_9ACTN|nr:hypothetical protein [Streptomyces zagrosensis]MBB5933776.1 hypothetical protein [Streptomyces zagrosensis]
MSTAVVGLATGMALGFAGYFGGFTAFLLVAALGTIGFIIGRMADGTLHWSQLIRRDDSAPTRHTTTNANSRRSRLK